MAGSLFQKDIHKIEIDDTDVETAIEKMRDYAGWATGSKEHLQLMDFEVTFYECVRDHVKAEYQGMHVCSRQHFV